MNTTRPHPNRTVIKKRQFYITRPRPDSNRHVILLSLGSFTSRRAAFAAIWRASKQDAKHYQVTSGAEIMMQPASFEMEGGTQ